MNRVSKSSQGLALSSKAYLETTLHLNSLCMPPTHPPPNLSASLPLAGLKSPRSWSCRIAILYQACDKQTQVVICWVPRADLTSDLRQLEVTNITLGIYPQGSTKCILFQTATDFFQKEQLKNQIPLFQKYFSPAGELRDGRCKSKFPPLRALLHFKFLPWVWIICRFVKFILKILHMN